MIRQMVSTPRAASQIRAWRVVATPFAMGSTGLDSRLERSWRHLRNGAQIARCA